MLATKKTTCGPPREFVRLKIAKPPNGAARQRYDANHKDVLRQQHLMNRARSDYNKMVKERQSLASSTRPRMVFPSMSKECPFFGMRDNEELYLRTAKTMIDIRDELFPDGKDARWSRKYVRAMLLKCHPDRFASSIYEPTRAEIPEWTRAVNHFSSMIHNLNATQQLEFVECLAQARRFLARIEEWERGDSGSRWAVYSDCTTFDQFYARWLVKRDDRL